MRFKLVLLILFIAGGAAAGGYLAVAQGIPSISELKNYRSTNGTKVYADDDSLIGEFKVEKGIFVPYEKIPDNVKNAVIAVEDSRFWHHSGIDYIGIARALFQDIIHASLKEGGSTITQQLAKIMFLSPEKTIKRKLREAQLAVKLEKELSKKEILEMYLNKVYLGHGAYGIEMASRVYFGKSAMQLSLPEAAMLAGLVKAPSNYSPYNDLVKAKERQEVVLGRIEDAGYITASQRAAAKAAVLSLSSLRANTDTYNYFLEYVRQQLEQKYGVETVYKGGMKVYTTLSKNAQLHAQRALQDGLREIDKRRGWRGPVGHKDLMKEDTSEHKAYFTASAGDISTGVVESVDSREAVVKARGLTGKLLAGDALWAGNVAVKGARNAESSNKLRLTDILHRGDIIWVKFKSIGGKNVTFSLEQEPDIEGAVVALEPETGYVKAIVGGYSFTRSEFNRAINALRQPGSAFKPIIYAAALEHNFTPASIIDDSPVSYPGGPGGTWRPENYDRQYYGPTRLREALAYSRNIVTVKLVEAVGIDTVIAFARDAGVQTNLPRELTIALGSVSIAPMELAATYATFANGGIKMNPISIKYITDAAGNVLESNDPEGVEAVTTQSAFLITSMMKDVIRYGTGMRADIGRVAAGKTGTSNDYKDAWFVGYTPQLVGCVWVGYDDMRKSLGRGEVGGRAAAPIWANFMRNTLAGEPVEDFQMPEGIVRLPIDPATGLLAHDEPTTILGWIQHTETPKVYEFFKEGTQPTEYSAAPVHEEKAPAPGADYD
ncbi:MAG: PBP1A family penicillin-binding protein [Nitrospirae bacterium]|nr:PBP1A family penicillin-binding protein [Nitrospirota bacterium]